MEASFQHHLPGPGEGLCGREQLPLERLQVGRALRGNLSSVQARRSTKLSLERASWPWASGPIYTDAAAQLSLWEHLSVCVFSCSVSDSLRPLGLRSTRLLCPWNFPVRILEWVAISSSRRAS